MKQRLPKFKIWDDADEKATFMKIPPVRKENETIWITIAQFIRRIAYA